ncbi:redoxin domain-containing protein [Aerococcaceae bacterium WGS1372]
MQIKRGDQIINLVGNPIDVGETFPMVDLIDRNQVTVSLKNYINGLTIISIVPDINTRTCDIQTNRFAALAKEKDYPIITISTNDPEDIVNWCQANNVDMTYLSDVNRQLADQSGLLMAEYDKLARTVLVVDGAGKVHYREIVADMRDEPDYDTVIAACEKLK